MKNIVLFPGTDAVENPILRSQALMIPRVIQKVRKTEKIIKEMFNEDIALLDYMKSPNDLSIHGFRKLVFCSLATQVALYENYVDRNGKPDCVMGLSLGDVPRSVVSGLVSYEEGVRSLYLFVNYNRFAKEGLCVHVKMERTFEQNKGLLRLEEFGIHESVIQNEKFGLLAGSAINMNQWIQEVGMKSDFMMKPMYPFALHTELMKPVADRLKPHIEKACQIDKMHTEIFSTVYGKVLYNKDEIINDCTENIAQALNFPEAVKKALEHYEDVRFINIGPSDSLLKFLSFMKLPRGTKLIDWYEVSLIAA